MNILCGLYDTALDVAAINKFLVMQDVAVIGSQLCHDTLEDLFQGDSQGVLGLLKMLKIGIF